jgi:cysteinyl-tRNA synthetase
MILKLYNTMSRAIEEVHPRDGHSMGLYACGPTVYHFAHIGNLRTFIFVDVLRRTLRALGYRVRHVMNITDVDDKTIRGAREAGLPLREFTAKYEKLFLDDLTELQVEIPEILPRATEHMADMGDLIRRLLERGAAYVSEDRAVYFRLAAFPNYGCLAHLDRDGLQAGARVSQDEYHKESFGDFVLWKPWHEADGDVGWDLDLPNGDTIRGRPGWHLECSAMSMRHLGEQFDIHCGGSDLVFPHHENEIAQSESATGKTFVRVWAHAAHLLINGEKMSKTLGNIFTLADVKQKGFDGIDLRYALMATAHYRKNLDFKWSSDAGGDSALEVAHQAVLRLGEWRQRWEQAGAGALLGEPSAEAQAFLERFFGALAGDLNVSGALGELFTFVRATNKAMDDGRATGNLKFVWDRVNEVLGLDKAGSTATVPDEVARLADERSAARQRKEWKRSDELRDHLHTLGWQVKDTKSGQELSRL